jgi:acyl-CoA hydrolase
VDHVVTEYGVASLRGRSLAERARELINIAHPDHRDQLRFVAHRAGPLPRIRSRTKKESWPTPLPIR